LKNFMRQVRTTVLLSILLSTCTAMAESSAPPGGSAKQATTIIHAGVLLDVPGKAPRREQSIIVRDGKIAEVRPGYIAAAAVGESDARVIDLSKNFVLPGLIEGHDHITIKSGRNRRVWDTTVDDASQALYGAYHAKLTLDAGFTTVRDVGSFGNSAVALRNAINEGVIVGPRLLVAGHFITAVGGHGDISSGYVPSVQAALLHDGICSGADDCRRAVRQQVKNGSDLIKVMATGGVTSDVNSGTGKAFTDEELRAIVETAHELGRKVAAHAHSASGINAALRAGVDSIEHGTFLDDESIRLFKQHGAYLVATISVGDVLLHKVNDPTSPYPPVVRAKAREVVPYLSSSTAKAFRAGVTIVFGTDASEPEHGRNADEFLSLVKAGLPPMEAIKAATVNAASLLGLSAEIGTIEAGKAADIIATAASPLDDISELQRVRFVMHDGTVIRD
jgi:imidazolonepropionase-like amidohydrolase